MAVSVGMTAIGVNGTLTNGVPVYIAVVGYSTHRIEVLNILRIGGEHQMLSNARHD